MATKRLVNWLKFVMHQEVMDEVLETTRKDAPEQKIVWHEVASAVPAKTSAVSAKASAPKQTIPNVAVGKFCVAKGFGYRRVILHIHLPYETARNMAKNLTLETKESHWVLSDPIYGKRTSKSAKSA